MPGTWPTKAKLQMHLLLNGKTLGTFSIKEINEVYLNELMVGKHPYSSLTLKEKKMEM